MEYPIYTKYETIFAKQYADYIEIKSDFEKIKRFSKYYTERYSMEILSKNPNPDRELQDSVLIPLQSIFGTIIIIYGKCFDKMSNRRKIILDDDFFVGADEEIKKKHKNLKDIRDKYLAHADKTQLENHQMLIGIHEDGSIEVKPSPENHKTLAGEVVEEKNLIPLIDEILRRIELNIVKLKENINDEILLLESHHSEFVNKIKNGLTIGNNEINFARKQALKSQQ